MAELEPPRPVTLTMRLEWERFPDLPLLAADHMLVSFRGDVYHLTIGQTQEPLFSPQDEENMAEIAQIPSLQIKPLARFVVPRTKMVEWADVLHQLVSNTSGLTAEQIEATDD